MGEPPSHPLLHNKPDVDYVAQQKMTKNIPRVTLQHLLWNVLEHLSIAKWLPSNSCYGISVQHASFTIFERRHCARICRRDLLLALNIYHGIIDFSSFFRMVTNTDLTATKCELNNGYILQGLLFHAKLCCNIHKVVVTEQNLSLASRYCVIAGMLARWD